MNNGCYLVKKNKITKPKFFYVILYLILLVGIIFTLNNSFLYQKPIAKIIAIDETYVKETEEGNYGYKTAIYEQNIKAIIKNTQYKDRVVTIKNTYHKGEVYTQRYHKNDEVFISLNITKDDIKTAHIEGYKRDKYIVVLTSLFIIIITIIGKSKGLLSFISVIANIFLFNIVIYFNAKGISLILLSFVSALLSCTICLTLVSGFNKKTISAIISSCCGLTITMLISLIVIHISNYNGLRFDQMELLTRPYEGIFISEIIMGGLGAIMDIAITISSSLNEIIEKNNQITLKELITSGKNIGRDVTSTMINVLFFTYICGAIPNLVLYFKNGISISSLINEFISLEMARALIGGIGICITIIISIFITILLYKRSLNHE